MVLEGTKRARRPPKTLQSDDFVTEPRRREANLGKQACAPASSQAAGAPAGSSAGAPAGSSVAGSRGRKPAREEDAEDAEDAEEAEEEPTTVDVGSGRNALLGKQAPCSRASRALVPRRLRGTHP